MIKGGSEGEERGGEEGGKLWEDVEMGSITLLAGRSTKIQQRTGRDNRFLDTGMPRDRRISYRE